MELIKFYLDKAPRRIKFYISHWVSVTYNIFKHVDNAVDEMCATMDGYFYAVSSDIISAVLSISMHTIAILFSQDHSNDTMVPEYHQSALLESMHYHNDRLIPLYEFPFFGKHTDYSNDSLTQPKFIAPIYLREYTFAIGDQAIALSDWCYRDILTT